MSSLYSLEFIITGRKIQKSGFRSAVESVALDIGITGTAENLKKPDQTGKTIHEVRIIAEGSEDELKEFLLRVGRINTFHQVNQFDDNLLNSKKQIEHRSYSEFVIKRDEKSELPERMDEAVHYVKHLYGEMHSLKEDTNKNFETMERKYHAISENLTLRPRSPHPKLC